MSRQPAIDEQTPQAMRKHLRERSLAARAAMDERERTVASARIRAALAGLLADIGARRLGLYWPVRGEVDVRETVGAWLAQDASRAAGLPVVTAPRTAMTFRRWAPGAAMTDDAYGIAIPERDERLQPDCLVLPLVAFDQAGHRLGYGAGYFDRTIAALAAAGQRPSVIGLGFERLRCRTIHPQPHDAPLDWLITEAGLFGRDGGTMRAQT
ncbi:MAG: 5-formyltetrahydrofolate cyclo-ligase [Sterolibacteriaceae bacterium]|nr:5-formyltetrahydrofolate cyclo-ligase [Candidatus Methylophosphatis haderslevensis]